MADARTRIFEPRDTRRWSTRELDALIGKHVAAQVDGTEASGTVTEAGIDRSGMPFIQFEHGGSVSWDRDTEQATIAVTYAGIDPTKEQ